MEISFFFQIDFLRVCYSGSHETTKTMLNEKEKLCEIENCVFLYSFFPV